MAFNLWMGCYSAQEIADAIGYSKPAVIEFTNFLQSVGNGIGADSDLSSENPELANDSENREFDEDEQDDSNSLGVYKLDKRLLIKSPAFRVYQPTRARVHRPGPAAADHRAHQHHTRADANCEKSSLLKAKAVSPHARGRGAIQERVGAVMFFTKICACSARNQLQQLAATANGAGPWHFSAKPGVIASAA